MFYSALNRAAGRFLEQRRKSRIDAGSGTRADFVRSSKWLLETGDPAGAGTVASRGSAAFPGDIGLMVQNAWVALAKGNLADAAGFWCAVRQLQPRHTVAWVNIAALERIHSKVEEAQATIKEALILFPGHHLVQSEAARIYDRSGLYPQALLIWDQLRSRFPKREECWQGSAYDLIHLMRYDEAEAVLQKARKRFPESKTLFATAGLLATRRENWDDAILIWTKFRDSYPDDITGWDNLGRTLTSKYLSDIDKGLIAADGRPVEVPRAEDETIRQLLLNFESLGSDCEFGMVQRRYGAEPLGLLRWNYVVLESLMAAISARFDRMGDPDVTEFWPGQAPELYIHDKRWGLAMHTFLSSKTTDKAALYPKMCQRISYLRRKMIEDLEAGEKIFVFKTGQIRTTDVLALHDLLLQAGPVTLLCAVATGRQVHPGQIDGAAGEVRKLRDGLYAGFIGRLGGEKGYWDIAFDDWISICGQTHEMRARAPALSEALE